EPVVYTLVISPLLTLATMPTRPPDRSTSASTIPRSEIVPLLTLNSPPAWDSSPATVCPLPSKVPVNGRSPPSGCQSSTSDRSRSAVSTYCSSGYLVICCRSSTDAISYAPSAFGSPGGCCCSYASGLTCRTGRCAASSHCQSESKSHPSSSV